MAEKGAYIIKKEGQETADLILLSTGSELHLALEAADKLESEGASVRVVSMPCIEIFEEQPEEYQNKVLPPQIKNRLSIEAASTLGWHRWVGSEGIAMGLDRFGTSAPYQDAYDTLKSDIHLMITGKSQKNMAIKSNDLGGFYNRINSESNSISYINRDHQVKLYANIALLVMIVLTFIITIRKYIKG